MPATTSHEEILSSLVHDLRQPLGTLETSLFCLNLVLDPASERVREHLQMMENQVARAATVLNSAVEELRAMRAQKASTESLPLTNSVTAGVT